MTATPAVIGLSAGKRLLSTSFCPSSELSDKIYAAPDHGSLPSKSMIVAQKSSHCGSNAPSNRQAQVIKALKQHEHTSATSIGTDDWFHTPDVDPELESSLEALVLLHKSMLEKQWELPFDERKTVGMPERSSTKRDEVVARSGISARQRRMSTRRKFSMESQSRGRPARFTISPELLQSKNRNYLRGTVSQELLPHTEVVQLSKKIKAGLSLEQRRSKLKEKLGIEPSDKELAHSLRMSTTELRSRMLESSLAREMLAMSNVRLVMSIAQKYDNLGVELADLIQGGLIGLLRGIEKFDASRGFRISTYVYWWIRQGVSRALVENSRTLRLPTYLHERLIAIRGAKHTLEYQGITPTIDNIAESLNISAKKVRNATEAVNKVLSLDQPAFPSLNGLPGETLHSYVADENISNDPWHGFEEWCLKDEVNKLLHSTLSERERDIIRLYHGLGKECHTWEDISRQIGLSRERVRQVGLVAMEKLKHAARRKKLEAMLVDH